MKLLRGFYRSRLNKREVFFYDGLLRNIRQLALCGEVCFPGKYDKEAAEELFAAYHALREDRPEYYFMTNTVRSSQNGDGITLYQEVRFSREHLLRINNLLRATLCEITEGCSGLPVVDREQLVYARIAGRYSYDRGDLSHDLSGLLVLGSGVCEALSSLLVVSLREVDIPAIKLRGYGKKTLHSWCVALINGRARHLDVTWDLGSKGNPFLFRYFNLTEKEIKRDHTLLVEAYGKRGERF